MNTSTITLVCVAILAGFVAGRLHAINYLRKNRRFIHLQAYNAILKAIESGECPQPAPGNITREEWMLIASTNYELRNQPK